MQVWGGPGGWNSMYLFGPTMAVAVLDARSERTRKQILSHTTYQE
jgi:hypothetical protein